MKKTDHISSLVLLYSKNHLPTSGNPLRDISYGLEFACGLPSGFYRKNLFRVFLTVSEVFENFKDNNANDFWKTMFDDYESLYALKAVDFHTVASKMIGCLGIVRVRNNDEILVEIPEVDPKMVEYMIKRLAEDVASDLKELSKNNNLH